MTGANEAADEATAWAEVLAAWEDETAHRGYLGRCLDLEALARAGGRYREVLAARPDDPVAARWRDEVIRRATAAGLASIPRGEPAVLRLPRWFRPAFLGLFGAALVGLAVALFRLLMSPDLHPPAERGSGGGSSWSLERP